MNKKFFKKKYIFESNTVNNMKLMILAKILVILVPPAHAQRVFINRRYARMVGMVPRVPVVSRNVSNSIGTAQLSVTK